MHQARSGIDGMTTSGTTGAHPREDSPPMAGPGIRDSGITTAGYSSTTETTGTDSKVENGSDMVDKSQLSQRFLLAQKSADLSISLKSGASQLPSDLRLSQDARSVLVEHLHTTCGKTERHAISSEESLCTKNTKPVRQEDLISGLESLDASKVQYFPRED